MSDADLTPSPSASHRLFEKYSKNSDQFYHQFYLCLPLGILIICTYIPIRIMWPKIFEVRRRRSKRHNNSDPDSGKPLMDGDDYPDISKRSLFMWILEVWHLDTNDVYFYGGYDSAVLIIMLRGFLQICIASLPYALLVLLPFYATQIHGSKWEKYEDWLDIISVKTVDGSSNRRFYALTIGAYLFSLITLYFLNNMYLKIAMVTDQWFVGSNEMPSDINIDEISCIKYSHKAKWFSHRNTIDHHGLETNYSEIDDLITSESDKAPPIEKYSVMIRDLPHHLRTEERLKELMYSMCGDHVCDVVVVPDIVKLLPIEKKVKKYKSKLTKLTTKHDLTLDDLVEGEHIPKVVGRPKCCGLCGPKVNLFRYYKKRYNEAVRSLNDLRDSKLPPTPTAFVTFNTLEATTTFVQSTKSMELVDCKVMMAPRVQDIFWKNLHFHSKQLILRRLCVTFLMVLLLMFWSIPVLAIASLANLTQTAAAFGYDINELFDRSIVAMLSGSLSVFILYGWMKALPYILDMLCKILKPVSRQELILSFIWRYYLCLLSMVLLVTVIASAILNNADGLEGYLKNFADNIGNIAELLAEGLSNMSIYFVLYFTMKTFVMIPVQLFRPSFWWKTIRKSKKLHQFSFYRRVPRHLLMFTILLTYSVMNPILWIFGFLYFLLTMIVLKYQFTMAYIPVFEIGPPMWVLVFDLLRWSFVLSIKTLYGFILLKQNYFCSVMLLPLLLLVLHRMWEIKQRFRKMFKSAALTTARRMDSEIGNEWIRENGHDAYYPPVLSQKYTKL